MENKKIIINCVVDITRNVSYVEAKELVEELLKRENEKLIAEGLDDYFILNVHVEREGFQINEYYNYETLQQNIK